MPAVVRLKRRIDEAPHTAFVLNGKRRRLLNDATTQSDETSAAASPTAAAATTTDKEELTTVLKFAGTLEHQDDSATKQFAATRLNKFAANKLVERKMGATDSADTATRKEKLRQETRETSREHRYHVVNCLRSSAETNSSHADDAEHNLANSSNQITIVDIESQDQDHPSDNQQEQQQPADSDIGYVYDLYIPETEQQAEFVDMMDDNYLRVCPVDEVILEDCYNNDEDETDSQDSNQENYFTNDYPDEDGDGDDEICNRIRDFGFDDDDDDDDCEFPSSSDDEDYNKFRDPYIHTLNSERSQFVDDVDFCNVGIGSSEYMRFKRRMMRARKDNSDDDLDEDDD